MRLYSVILNILYRYAYTRYITGCPKTLLFIFYNEKKVLSSEVYKKVSLTNIWRADTKYDSYYFLDENVNLHLCFYCLPHATTPVPIHMCIISYLVMNRN